MPTKTNKKEKFSTSPFCIYKILELLIIQKSNRLSNLLLQVSKV